MTSFPTLVGLTAYAAPSDSNNLTVTLPSGIQRQGYVPARSGALMAGAL